MQDFHMHLRTIRKDHKSTQKQVAVAIGVTERNYQDWEYGKTKPGFDSLISLADYFDVSLDFLVGRSEDLLNGGFYMAQANPYPLRVDKIVMEKFKVIASNNGRSVNKEIETLIKQVITDYEQRHGLIEIPDHNK